MLERSGQNSRSDRWQNPVDFAGVADPVLVAPVALADFAAMHRDGLDNAHLAFEFAAGTAGLDTVRLDFAPAGSSHRNNCS